MTIPASRSTEPAAGRLRIVDAHVHATGAESVSDLVTHGDEPYWEYLLSGGGPVPPPVGRGYTSLPRLVDDMDAAGIDRVILHAGYRTSRRGSAAANDLVLSWAARYPERIIPFVTVNPADLVSALAELERTVAEGARGVGELNPYSQGFAPVGDEIAAVLDRCAEHGLPVTLHVNGEAGRTFLGKSSVPIGAMYDLAIRAPGTSLIFAHWGGGLPFYEIIPEVADRMSHVRYDTAASPLTYPTRRVFTTVLSAVPASKILYGSDYPLPAVRDQPETDFRPFLRELTELDLPAEDRAAIMGGNALALFGIEQSSIPRGSGVVADWAPERSFAERLELPIDPALSVQMVARRHPKTRAVFERFGIPWTDSPVPVWEPIIQAAAARGLGTDTRRALLEELERVIGA